MTRTQSGKPGARYALHVAWVTQISVLGRHMPWLDFVLAHNVGGTDDVNVHHVRLGQLT
jgi:hypothetical protein